MKSAQRIIEEQKVVADDVLQRLFPIDPFAIVAGGAPRDWSLGTPATDIDVYLHIRPGISKGFIQEMLESVGFRHKRIVSEEEQEATGYRTNPLLMTVFWCEDDMYGYPVQIMVMKEPTFTSVLDYFPYHICRAWYKDGKVHGDHLFQASIRDKLVIRTKTEHIYGAEHRYKLKMLDKFPPSEGWKWYDEQSLLSMYLQRGDVDNFGG